MTGHGPSGFWRRAASAMVRLYPPPFRRRFGVEIQRAIREAGSNDLTALADAMGILVRAWTEQITSTLQRLRRTPNREAIMSTLFHDIRFAMRNLASRPGFLGAAVLTLGLGIGATTSIFSVVNGILLRPLPYPEADRLVNVWQIDYEFMESPNPGLRAWADRFPASMPIIDDWVELTPHLFDGVGGYASTMATRRRDGRVEEVPGMRTTSGVWRALGVAPVLGRVFGPADDRIGAPPGVILAHDYWRQTFGGDSTVVGRTLELDNTVYTVVGVMPGGFYFPNDDQRFWATFDDTSKNLGRNTQFLQAIARLRPGFDIETAGRELDAVTDRIAERTEADRERGARLVPRMDEVVGDVRKILLVLLGAVGVVLLTSCVNIANLLLVRATERRREIAIRSALGAHRGRLVRQLLTESLVLGVIGGLVGVAMAVGTLDPLIGAMPSDIPRLDEITLDQRVLWFSVAITLITGLLVGAIPALTSTRTDAARGLRDSGRTATAGPRRVTTQGVLVIMEVALAFVLLLGGGLLTKSFVNLINVDRGFDGHGLITLRVGLRGERYEGNTERRHVFAEQLTERLRAIPGVRSLTIASQMPIMGGTSSGTVTVDTDDGPAETNVEHGVVGAGYFATLGIPVVMGREFTEQDREGGEPVAVVSRSMSERYWPNGAVGRRFKLGSLENTEADWITVVGVVGDVRHQGLAIAPRPKLYRPFAQSPQRHFSVALSVGDTPVEGIGAAIRNAVWDLEPDVPLDEVQSMSAALSASVASPRFRMVLIVALAGLAGMLAIVGIYGVLAFTVSQRTSEIGIRIALGAGRRQVLGEIVGRGLVLSTIGLALGFAIAVVAVRVLEDFLFETAAMDPLVLTVVATVLAGAGLAASYLPARRALRVDPVHALRTE